MPLAPALRSLLAPLSACALLAAVTTAPAADRSFVIPANDGYGIADCLGEGGSCGRMVADAWCAAQGMGKATAFGPTDPTEMTASLRTDSRAVQAYTITCNE